MNAVVLWSPQIPSGPLFYDVSGWLGGSALLIALEKTKETVVVHRFFEISQYVIMPCDVLMSFQTL